MHPRQAVIDAAQVLLEAMQTEAFLLRVEGADPPVFVAYGTAEQIAALVAPSDDEGA